MAHIQGAFFGYRELARPPRVRMPSWRFTPPDPEQRLEYWHWDLMGPTTFWYDVYRGLAEDSYPADFVLFPFEPHMSRLIIATIRDAPAYIIFTYDGETEQPERRFDLGFARLEAIRGFKIKNAEPGRVCRYQMIPMI